MFVSYFNNWNKKYTNKANSENLEPAHMDFHCLQMYARIYLRRVQQYVRLQALVVLVPIFIRNV